MLNSLLFVTSREDFDKSKEEHIKKLIDLTENQSLGANNLIIETGAGFKIQPGDKNEVIYIRVDGSRPGQTIMTIESPFIENYALSLGETYLRALNWNRGEITLIRKYALH